MRRKPQPPEQPAPDNGDAAYLDLARSLRESVERQVRGEATGLPADLDVAMARAFHDAAEPLLAERLRALSPLEFAGLYGRTLGEAALGPHLQTLRDTEATRLERTARLARIREEARQSGLLQLTHLPVGEGLRIGLFEAKEPGIAGSRFRDDSSRAFHREMRVRLLEPETGLSQVINDTWLGPVWAEAQRDTVPAHSRGRIGSAILTAGEMTIEPELSLHAPLSHTFNSDGPFTVPQIIGYIEASDKTMLLDY
jgi:hypothetical protein